MGASPVAAGHGVGVGAAGKGIAMARRMPPNPLVDIV
jgi:hypothetical protein